LIAWIAAHPVASGAVIGAITFCDALAVIGIVMPTAALLVAVGALVARGHLDAVYAVSCAAVGAFAGDALSFGIGHCFGPQLRRHWPFRRYPRALERGEHLFQRHGGWAVVIGRYVGAVRPFVPAVAGMLRMRTRLFLAIDAIAAVSWAALSLGAGWLVGLL